MKRFHVHVSVENLEESIRFYSTLFRAEPIVSRTDYAKWMLDDPRVNFAISQRDRQPGINHLGFQVDSGEELASMRTQLEAADTQLTEQTSVTCCYARSDKHWVTDPSGIAWETFRSLGELSIFGENNSNKDAAASSCCVPPAQAASEPSSSCCVPARDEAMTSCCT